MHSLFISVIYLVFFRVRVSVPMAATGIINGPIVFTNLGYVGGDFAVVTESSSVVVQGVTLVQDSASSGLQVVTS